MEYPPPQNPDLMASEEEQRAEVQRVIREIREASARLGPCPTSVWLEEAARSACLALAGWDSPTSRSAP